MFKGIFERTVSKAPLPYSANSARNDFNQHHAVTAQVEAYLELIKEAACRGEDYLEFKNVPDFYACDHKATLKKLGYRVEYNNLYMVMRVYW